MTDNSLSSTDRALPPNLAFTDPRGSRYPNQFFDIAQQYMPPTIKELFRWCTFYFYNSPLIGAAIKKVSRYPITDLQIDDGSQTSRDIWKKILVDTLKIKDRLMEVNLDYHAYGNCFVSIHFPFTRFLICNGCGFRAPINQWNWSFSSASFAFTGKCEKCSKNKGVSVKDIPHKDIKGIKLIRWNPENVHIKYNEYTGRYIYMYAVPSKLKNAIFRGDKDVIEDIPLIVLEALKARRLIRFHENSVFHLKNPTLAEQDQGWGKPTIIHVLKDMYYLYTLRRAQEAIALEHIVPFDIIYPLPNAQQDPYIHTDLGSWKSKIEEIIKRHRKDPNYKGVIPIPVGFGRIGGDGKALMLSPEMNYLTQTIVGGMGIPQEFLFGGLNFTGSSISLRTLENDFVQNRSQLLDLVTWVKDRIRAWKALPDCKSLSFSDFRMADDVQRNQQMIGLNAQGKISDQTMLTELGYDYEEEIQKRIEEVYVQNHLNDLMSKGSSKSQGEAQVIQYNYQQKIQELAEKAQKEAQKKLQKEQRSMPVPDDMLEGTPQEEMMQQGGFAGAMGSPMQMAPLQQQQQELPAQAGTVSDNPADEAEAMIANRISSWASKLMQMEPSQAKMAIAEIKMKMPDMGAKLEQRYNQVAIQATSQGEAQVSNTPPAQPAPQGVDMEAEMAPMPEKSAPRRGSVTGAG